MPGEQSRNLLSPFPEGCPEMTMPASEVTVKISDGEAWTSAIIPRGVLENPGFDMPGMLRFLDEALRQVHEAA